MKHHYAPEFYLGAWAGEKGLLCEYKRVLPQKIVPRRISPGGTGHAIDLYRIDGLPEEQAHAFETVFLRLVDNQACDALRKVAAFQNLNDAERSAMTRLMLSFLFRNPEAVAEIKGHMLDVWNVAIDSLREDFSEDRFSEERAALLEQRLSVARYTRAMNLLHESIDNPVIGGMIFRMRWACVSVEQASGTLLTSDRPLEFNGLELLDTLITLPLGPRHLLIASHQDYSSRLRSIDPDRVVEEVNKGVVARARSMVWGVDDTQLEFVREWMVRAPDRVLLRPEQKQAAIDAARGDAVQDIGLELADGSRPALRRN